MNVNHYRNYRPYRQSRSENIVNLIDKVIEHLNHDHPVSKAYRINLTQLLLDLFVRYSENPDGCISVSMSERGYRKKSRYNPSGVSSQTIKIIKDLTNAGLIHFKRGFQNKENPSKAFRSKIAASPKLVEFFQWYDLEENEIGVVPEMEPIVLRDSNKTTIEYFGKDEPDWLHNSRDILKRYNELLQNTFIDIGILEKPFVTTLERGKEKHVVISQNDKFVRRVFNNKSFEQGGRFYGGWWQRIPNRVKVHPDTGEEYGTQYRKHILINDKSCIERDYSGMHILMLYAMEGIDYSEHSDNEPYRLIKPTPDTFERKDIKQSILYALNAYDETSAFQAFNNDRGDDGKPRITKEHFKSLIKAITDTHPLIEKYLFSGIGIRLQFKDSQIAEYVIREFTDRLLPVLCLHDGFIVQQEHIGLLEEIMDKAFCEVMKARTSLSKNEWVTEREIVDRVTPYRHLDRDYYLDTIMNLQPYRSTEYKDRLKKFNFCH